MLSREVVLAGGEVAGLAMLVMLVLPNCCEIQPRTVIPSAYQQKQKPRGQSPQPGAQSQ